MSPATGDGRLPDIADPSVVAVSIEYRSAIDAIEQQAVADSVMEQDWRLVNEQRRSLSCFVSIEPIANAGLLRGTTAAEGADLGVVAYAQWTDVPAAGPPPLFDRYRSFYSSLAGAAPATGCIVLVTVDFDGPDPNRLRQWIDGVVDALDADPQPSPGLIAAHFHTSVDGRRVVNYAQWTSAQAHRDVLEHGAGGIGQADLPEWRRVREFPGVVGNTVGRYRLYRSTLTG